MSDVILVSEHFPPAIGGSAVLFGGIYSRLPEHRVTVLTDSGGAASGPAAVGHHLEVVRRPLASSEWGVLHPSGLRHHLRVAAAIREVAEGRDAIVHCGRALPEGAAAWLARRAGGPRYVCWAHGEDLSTAATSRELRFMTSRILRGASMTLANSRHTASMLARFGVPPDSVRVVYPGVDGTRFHPGVDGRAVRAIAGAGETVLLSVGRLQCRKGHDLVIAALAAMGQGVSRFRYVIAGDGEERARLEQLAAWHGLSGRVHFCGVVEERDLPAYYAAADIFVLPNRIEGHDLEGFGIVFLEAAASGKPAIGGHSGGVPEAIAEGETGLLVSGTDAGELAAAIQRLGRSAGLRQRMGEAARARAVTQFSWRRAASLVTALPGSEPSPVPVAC